MHPFWVEPPPIVHYRECPPPPPPPPRVSTKMEQNFTAKESHYNAIMSSFLADFAGEMGKIAGFHVVIKF